MKTLNNRELSLLCFNRRVLQEAEDESVPPIQRLRFLGIYSNNMEEFFKVRVANIKRMCILAETRKKILSGGYSPCLLIEAINERVSVMQQEFYEIYGRVTSHLANLGIRIVDQNTLSHDQLVFLENYFNETIMPHIIPLMLSAKTQINNLLEDGLYLAVDMENKSGNSRYAIIEISSFAGKNRFIVLPSQEDRRDLIFIDDVIRIFLKNIFFMFDFVSVKAYAFQITRDAELAIDDDLSKSLIDKLNKGLNKRLLANAVRVLHDRQMPLPMLNFLVKKIKLKENVIPAGRYLKLSDMMKFPRFDGKYDYTPIPVSEVSGLMPFSNIFSFVDKQDVLLNYPYHNFSHLIDLLRQAAVDPYVKSIKITLYRTAQPSMVINALINAAHNGKAVTAMVELLARFDEKNNIDVSQQLQSNGIKVINSVDGLKVHSKLLVIERNVRGKSVFYTYIATGNFNEDTARVYTDYALITSNQTIARDAQMLFSFLLDNHKRFTTKLLLVSPYSMRTKIIKFINREANYAKSGKKAYIYMKMNSLTDKQMIQRLYAASQAGVEIRLIVRGACCLRPGIKGLSENIKVISIVDRFLEHERVFIFGNNKNQEIYISSADLMNRNLDKRVEVATPILDSSIRQKIYDVFILQWEDNVKARIITADLDCMPKANNAGSSKLKQSQLERYDFYQAEIRNIK